MTRTAPTFYVLHGEDEFSLKAEIHAMRSKMGDPASAELNTAVFDGKTAAPADVIGAASVMPFLADKRLILVEGMLTWLSRKGGGKTAKAGLDLLTDSLPNLPDTARLVFAEFQTLDENNAVLKLASRDIHGYAKAFNPPRDTTHWIIKQVESHGGKIELHAAGALAAAVGSDLRAADSECLKLVLYAGERAITEADVAAMTAYVADAVIWDMVDALARREGAVATALMHRLLDDQEPLMILAMINRQFRLLLQTREVLDAGGDSRDLMQVPDIKYPRTAQKLAQQARNFSLDQLEDVYRSLLETDYAIKMGRIEAKLALDLLVTGLAA